MQRVWMNIAITTKDVLCVERMMTVDVKKNGVKGVLVVALRWTPTKNYVMNVGIIVKALGVQQLKIVQNEKKTNYRGYGFYRSKCVMGNTIHIHSS